MDVILETLNLESGKDLLRDELTNSLAVSTAFEDKSNPYILKPICSPKIKFLPIPQQASNTFGNPSYLITFLNSFIPTLFIMYLEMNFIISSEGIKQKFSLLLYDSSHSSLQKLFEFFKSNDLCKLIFFYYFINIKTIGKLLKIILKEI